MINYSLKTFKKRLTDDLIIIENSGLKDVNEKLYLELKSSIDDLNVRTLAYEEHKDGVTWDELVNRKVDIDVLFEFEMQTGGACEIARLKLKSIEDVIAKLIEKVNKSNYDKIERELDETLESYSDILNASSNSSTLDLLLIKFRYQVCKYKMGDLIIDDKIDVGLAMPYIMDDISAILADKDVSDDIKRELQKYSVDSSIIAANFKRVIVYINYGLNDKSASLEEIEEELALTYYNASDLVAEYQDPPESVSNYVKECAKKKNLPEDYKNFFEEVKDSTKETYTALAVDLFVRYADITPSMFNIIKPYFSNYKYLVEALIVNKRYRFIFLLMNRLSYYDNRAIFDIVCAIFAHISEIPDEDLETCVFRTKNELLIRYIIRSGNKKCFPYGLIDWALEVNHKKLLQYMNRELPEKIIRTLNNDKIPTLSSETLDSFADKYERQLNDQGLSALDMMYRLIENSNYFEIKLLITYIMHRGCLNQNMIKGIVTLVIRNVDYFIYLFGAAIRNAKDSYLRPAFLLVFLDSYDKIPEGIDYKVIFLENAESELRSSIGNDKYSSEVGELQRRKYYGDLLKFIDRVPENLRNRIIIDIARSNIREYIMYIKANYPDSLDLLLESISDVELYKELIDFNGTVSIDEALRIKMLEEKRPV